MAVNDDLADDAVLRSVRSIRAANGIWRELLPILRTVERDLLAKLETGAPTTLQSRRAQALLRDIRRLIDGGVSEFVNRLEGRGVELAEIEESAAFRSLERRVPLAIDWTRPSGVLLEAVATTKPFNGALLKDHMAKWADDVVFAMQAEIRTGIIEGEGIEPMQRRLRRVAEIKYIRDARTIARTYTAHVTNAARANLYEQNEDVISKEQWLATLDDRTCIRCAKLDNKTFSVGKGTQAPLHMNCRCLRIPITRSAEALAERGIVGTRAARNADGMTGEVPADMAFPQWLPRQSEAIQKEVLGAKRFELFKNGTPLHKFVNDENQIIPLSKLKDL